jgi:hypothetical protein
LKVYSADNEFFQFGFVDGREVVLPCKQICHLIVVEVAPPCAQISFFEKMYSTRIHNVDRSRDEHTSSPNVVLVFYCSF